MLGRHRFPALATALTLGAIVVACESGEANQAPAPATEAPVVATAEPTATPAAPTTAPTPVVTPSAAPAAAADTSSTVGEPRPAPELADLVLPDGSPFDLADLAGANTLVYFGYTHCPDVCPMTLGEVFGVFEQLPETQALFVTVDPERDTPEFLGEWTSYMPDNLYAVTGSPGAIRRAADNYGVKYARVETTSTAGYTMSHTAELYLIDADGQYRLAYPFGTEAAEIVADLEQLSAS
jgi:protein SCO1/2